MLDPRLVRAAGDGDQRALEELVRRLAAPVHRFMVGMLGDGRDATEATEEAFVRMVRSASRFDGGDPEDWAISLARRVASDHITWKRPTSPGPFGTLPHQHRELLVMREVLEWDIGRMSRALQADPDEVRDRLLAARGALLPSALVATELGGEPE